MVANLIHPFCAFPGARRYPRLSVVLGATLAVLVVWSVSVYIGRVDLSVPIGSETREVGPVAVTAATLVLGGIGWGSLRLLERRTDRAWTIWKWTAIAVTVISMFLGPITAETGPGKVTLGILHAVAAAIVIRGFSHTVDHR